VFLKKSGRRQQGRKSSSYNCLMGVTINHGGALIQSVSSADPVAQSSYPHGLEGNGKGGDPKRWFIEYMVREPF